MRFPELGLLAQRAPMFRVMTHQGWKGTQKRPGLFHPGDKETSPSEGRRPVKVTSRCVVLLGGQTQKLLPLLSWKRALSYHRCPSMEIFKKIFIEI